MKRELTYERASELLQYDPKTGKIYWKTMPSPYAHSIRIGDEAGALQRDKRNTYRLIRIDWRLRKAHRVAWLLYYGVWPKKQIDHCDGDGLNNRIENLREATNQDNHKNQRMYCNNASGHVGVYWNKQAGKWRVQIKINGKRKHLGDFDDYTDACAAQEAAARANGYSERHGVDE